MYVTKSDYIMYEKNSPLTKLFNFYFYFFRFTHKIKEITHFHIIIAEYSGTHLLSQCVSIRRTPQIYLIRHVPPHAVASSLLCDPLTFHMVNITTLPCHFTELET